MSLTPFAILFLLQLLLLLLFVDGGHVVAALALGALEPDLVCHEMSNLFSL
jgi:hypothetical protein